MRTITDHQVNGLNEALTIAVVDKPGPGGANHKYAIELSPPGRPTQVCAVLSFQNGPIASPDDMNGLTGEAIIREVLVHAHRAAELTHEGLRAADRRDLDHNGAPVVVAVAPLAGAEGLSHPALAGDVHDGVVRHRVVVLALHVLEERVEKRCERSRRCGLGSVSERMVAQRDDRLGVHAKLPPL